MKSKTLISILLGLLILTVSNQSCNQTKKEKK